MFKKMLIATAFLTASAASQASLISHFGYERDSASNIVRGGGLEWLKWDMTKGKSINQAQAIFGGDGWRIAHSGEIATLYNAFGFGRFWSPTDTANQSIVEPWTSSESSIHNLFMNVFGATFNSQCHSWQTSSCWSVSDPIRFAGALYVNLNNVRAPIYISSVRDDATHLDSNNDRNHHARMYAIQSSDYNYSENQSGVALVRNYRVDAPGPLVLAALGLLALGLRRRKA